MRNNDYSKVIIEGQDATESSTREGNLDDITPIALSDLLLRWGTQTFINRDANLLDSIRGRETVLRSWLPAGLLRRLDGGFARSNTVHPDTGRALYAICRALLPDCVFETGTYWGYATAYLAAAVRDNGRGTVHSFDIYEHAGKHLPRQLHPFVRLHRGRPSTEMMPAILKKEQPTLFFQDSRHDYEGVYEELKIVAPFLSSQSLILFHDFIAPEVRRAARDGLPGYDLFVLVSDDPQQLGVAFKS